MAGGLKELPPVAFGIWRLTVSPSSCLDIRTQQTSRHHTATASGTRLRRVRVPTSDARSPGVRRTSSASAEAASSLSAAAAAAARADGTTYCSYAHISGCVGALAEAACSPWGSRSRSSSRRRRTLFRPNASAALSSRERLLRRCQNGGISVFCSIQPFLPRYAPSAHTASTMMHTWNICSASSARSAQVFSAGENGSLGCSTNTNFMLEKFDEKYFESDLHRPFCVA